MVLVQNAASSLLQRSIGSSMLRPTSHNTLPFRNANHRCLLRRHLPSQRFTSSQTADPGPDLPPPRRFFPRFLFLTSLSVASLSLGIYLATLPQINTLTALLRSPSTPSSLAYLPSTERATEIDNLITNHPLVQRLRSDPEWTESRPHLRMPSVMQQHSLTASTLMGDTKIPVPPLMFTKGHKGEELVAISYLGADLCGHVGIIHGGMLATMLDEGLARCCFAALPSKVGVTARLEIDFRRPTKCEGFVVLKARTERVEGRKAWVKGRVEALPMMRGGDGEKVTIGRTVEVGPYEEKGEVLVEAEGLFVEPKWAKNLPAFARPA